MQTNNVSGPCEQRSAEGAASGSTARPPTAPRARSARANVCSTKEQLRILEALEDIDSDELSDIESVYRHHSSNNEDSCDSSDLDEEFHKPISFRKKKKRIYWTPGLIT